ncbi:MAG: hypothetical protein KDA60_10240, partial [Planctomycetales bacterium]|nr:hypothetical protein [Planctomycetales bacterium]
TILEKFLHHTSDPVPDPRKFRREIPGELVAVIYRMLAKSPKRRYQRPRDLYLALRDVAAHRGLSVTSSADSAIVRAVAGAEREEKRSRWVGWIVPAVLIACIAWAADHVPLRGHVAPTNIPTYVMPTVTDDNDEASADRISAPPPIAQSSGGNDLPETILPGAEASRPEPFSDTPERRAVDRRPEKPPLASTDSQRPDLTRPADDSGRSPLAPIVDDLDGIRTDTGFESVVSRAFQPSTSRIDTERTTPFEKPSLASAEPTGETPLPAPVTVIVRQGDAIDGATPSPANIVIVSSLQAALERATNDSRVDTIELQFSGPEVVAPLVMNELKVTIRAGNGYLPVLMFKPPLEPRIHEEKDMLTIVGGAIAFEDLMFELEIPHRTSSRWSLFSLEDVESLRLTHCAVTLAGRTDWAAHYYADASTFDLIAPDAEIAMPSMNQPEHVETHLVLEDCVIRGIGDVLTADTTVPFRMHWDHGLLATSQHLLVLGGGSQSFEPQERASINLKHVTALVDQGLVRVQPRLEHRSWIPLQLTCEHCIVIGQRDVPMITHVGTGESLDTMEQHFSFRGQQNFYEEMDTLWLLISRDEYKADFVEEEAVDFEAWMDRWRSADQNSLHDSVEWDRKPRSNVPRYELQPSDFRLSERPGNPARGNVLHDFDAGFYDPRRLPTPAPISRP